MSSEINDNGDEIKSMRERIQDLYEFRDKYFLTNPEEKYACKDQEIECKTKVTIDMVVPMY